MKLTTELHQRTVFFAIIPIIQSKLEILIITEIFECDFDNVMKSLFV